MLVHRISEVREKIFEARSRGQIVGFVPTMGALHEGHLALIRMAQELCNYVVVSIFVNPTQFGPNEDFNKYPRTLEEDVEKCDALGVDLVFAPSSSEMYPDNFDSWVEVKGNLTNVLEGEYRPGHFRGVATVCAKLFNIVQPNYAFFGQKDYQQLKVIQKMVFDLNMPVEIVSVDTVREPDGLAMSSRNRYLTSQEREAALILSRSLVKAQEEFHAGNRNAFNLKKLVEETIQSVPDISIDYVAVVDSETLREIEYIEKPAVILLAVRIGSTRLIDNTLLI